jgi:NAD(P)H-hydrate epimerase
LLKGRHTLVANRKTCQVITSGNPALAKAGTGDVLSGMIGGLLRKGFQQ